MPVAGGRTFMPDAGGCSVAWPSGHIEVGFGLIGKPEHSAFPISSVENFTTPYSAAELASNLHLTRYRSVEKTIQR